MFDSPQIFILFINSFHLPTPYVILFKNNRDKLLWKLSFRRLEIFQRFITHMYWRCLSSYIYSKRCIQERGKQCGKSENFGNDFLSLEGQMIHNHGDSNFTNRTLQTLQDWAGNFVKAL